MIETREEHAFRNPPSQPHSAMRHSIPASSIARTHNGASKMQFYAPPAKWKTPSKTSPSCTPMQLRTDPVLKKNKVLIFTEFADTARYLNDSSSTRRSGRRADRQRHQDGPRRGHPSLRPLLQRLVQAALAAEGGAKSAS